MLHDAHRVALLVFIRVYSLFFSSAFLPCRNQLGQFKVGGVHGEVSRLVPISVPQNHLRRVANI